MPAPEPLLSVLWHQLRVGEQLGEGASGNIHEVQVRDEGGTLALKLFKGQVTSDGLPQDELADCLVAGAHATLLSTCLPY